MKESKTLFILPPSSFILLIWCPRKDLNLQPLVCRTSAPSVELLRKKILDFEFRISNFEVRIWVAGLAGFEPATFCLEDRSSHSAELQTRKNKDEG